MSLSRNALSTLSANDTFKLGYPRYLKSAVLAVLALTALFVWLWPGYEAKPYRLRRQETCTLILVELEPVLPARWPSSTQPDAPVWPESEPVESFEIRSRPVICLEYRRKPVVPRKNRGPFHENFGVVRSGLPHLVSYVKPVYPELAHRLGIEGVVIVHVQIGPQGQVLRAVVAQPIHPLLDRAALVAARQCRFMAGTQRSMPVRTWVEIPYNFRLH